MITISQNVIVNVKKHWYICRYQINQITDREKGLFMSYNLNPQKKAATEFTRKHNQEVKNSFNPVSFGTGAGRTDRIS